MSYGTLGLSAATITIISIVMVTLYIIAAALYRTNKVVAGAVHLASIIMTLVLMATFLTAVDWAAWGPSPIFLSIIWGASAVGIPLAFGNPDSVF